MPNFYKKITSEKEKNIFMKYPRKFGEVPKVSDSLRCLVFFTDTVWIVGPLGQAIR